MKRGSRRIFTLVASISMLLTIYGLSSVHLSLAQSQDRYAALWSADLRVFDYEPNYGWWLKGYTSKSWTNAWTGAADELMFAVSQQGKFREVFCSVFGNSYNNTVFVVLTDVDKSTTDAVLEAMPLPSGVAVQFLKGEAPLYKLEEWMSCINTDELIKLGIPWVSLGITENATILLGLENITPCYVETIHNLITNKVQAQLLSQTDKIRPLVAGIKIQSIEDIYLATSTLNFLGKTGTQEGAIVAGHASDNGTGVWQPTLNDTNRIGTTTLNVGAYRYSDAAWVPLDQGVDGENLIYSSSYNLWVLGQVDYSGQYVGEIVESLGLTSGYRYGYIQEKDAQHSHAKYTTLYNQIQANFSSASGDSGSPVYQQYYEMGLHTADAFGILWGGGDQSGWTIYSPPDGVERDFGFDIDFAGP